MGSTGGRRVVRLDSKLVSSKGQPLRLNDYMGKAELELVLLGPGIAAIVKMDQEHAAPRDDGEYENGDQEGDDLVLVAGDVDAVSERGLWDRRPHDQAHQ